MRLPHLLLLLLPLLSTSSPLSLDTFLISFWVDPIPSPTSPPSPPTADTFLPLYQQVAAANFTLILGGFGATTPEGVSAQIAAAAQAGLLIIPSACESATGPFPNGSCVGLLPPPGDNASTLVGFQMWDEPAESDFTAAAAWMESVAQRAFPGALRFINLLPNYGFPGPNSTAAYEAYVSDFISVVKPDLLSFDHYPNFGPAHTTGAGPDGDDDNGNDDLRADTSMAGYHRNLAVISTAARANSLRFVNFFSSMPFNGRADQTESQLRWQAYTSLAYGAAGVLYFCYWSPDGASFTWGNAIIAPRVPMNGSAAEIVYSPGPHYAQAARINSKLRVLGDFLLPAAPDGVFLTSGNGTQSAAVPAGTPAGAVLATVGGSGSGPTWAVLLGAFTCGSSTRAACTTAVLVHNQDPDAALLLTLSLAGGAPVPREVDGETGSVGVAWDDAPGLAGWQVALEAGDARLFLF
jgi:hypothetical protein